MIITVASLKGGQAKTTSAVHIAALLGADAKTLLVDGDPNRSALNWHKRKGFPFEVCDERQAVKFSRDFKHIVFDTQARPSREDLEILAGGCDLLIIPLTPDALSLDTLFSFTDSLKQLGAKQFKVLLTIVPPKPATDGVFVRQTLEKADLPVFATDIRRYKAYQKAALAGVLVKDVADDYAAAVVAVRCKVSRSSHAASRNWGMPTATAAEPPWKRLDFIRRYSRCSTSTAALTRSAPAKPGRSARNNPASFPNRLTVATLPA